MSTCPECNSTIKPNYTGACVTCLRRENERLRSIVGKLPKTKDGVTVTEGMTVWSGEFDNPPRPYTMHLCGGYEGEISPELAYSTEEAALAAQSSAAEAAKEGE